MDGWPDIHALVESLIREYLQILDTPPILFHDVFAHLSTQTHDSNASILAIGTQPEDPPTPASRHDESLTPSTPRGMEIARQPSSLPILENTPTPDNNWDHQSLTPSTPTGTETARRASIKRTWEDPSDETMPAVLWPDDPVFDRILNDESALQNPSKGTNRNAILSDDNQSVYLRTKKPTVTPNRNPTKKKRGIPNQQSDPPWKIPSFQSYTHLRGYGQNIAAHERST